MFAVDPAIYGALSIVAVIVGTFTGLYQLVLNRRHNDRADDATATQVVVEGLRGLMAELRQKNDELEDDIKDLRTRIKMYRQEAQEANTHAARCERSLAQALRRIEDLERGG